MTTTDPGLATTATVSANDPATEAANRTSTATATTATTTTATAGTPSTAQPTEAASDFETLLAESLGPAFGFAVRLAGDRTQAEDIVQDAALQGFRHFHTYRSGTNFRSWFLTIVKNCYLMSKRRAGHSSSPVAIEDASPLYLMDRTKEIGWHAASEDPAAEFLRRMTTEQVACALTGLPEEFRLVCTLYFMEDLSYEEIGQIAGCPVGTVRSRLHRGRRVLQKALWEIAEAEGIVPRAMKEQQ